MGKCELETCCYVRQIHENYWTENELKDVRMYLPKRKSIQGRPPLIGTIDVESRFEWPSTIEYVGDKIKAKLMGLAIERAVVFFFNNFTYTFGGQVYRQKGGGPIGARLTMAVARLVMQQWKDEYNVILHDSDIIELLFGLYVDDGRTVHRKLYWGERFDPNLKKMVWDKDRSLVDIIN